MVVIGLFLIVLFIGCFFGFGYDGWLSLVLFGWIVGFVFVVFLFFLIVCVVSCMLGVFVLDLLMVFVD